MNIFQVLSQGKSRLHEPSMSAMLGYLLDSRENHGLDDTFLRIFLEKISKDGFKNSLKLKKIKCVVELESAYKLNGKDKYIGEVVEDASIKLSDGRQYQVMRRQGGQIQVFETESNEKVEAKSILIQFIRENNFGDLDPKVLNTRQVGMIFFDKYRTIKKVTT